MSDVILSRSVRSNLSALQSTADLISQTQNRLATGKRVNSALDNPTNFFTSAKLNSRANDLSSLLDNMSNAVKTIETADKGIKAITRLVESARSTANQALQDTVAVPTANLTIGSATTAASAAATDLNTIGAEDGDTLTISDGSTFTATFTVAASATIGSNAVATVGDLVDAINTNFSSSLKASFTSDGQVKIEGQGITSFSLTTGGTTATGDDLNAWFGINESGNNYTTSGGSAANTTTNVSATNSTRTTLATQFNTILSQISDAAEDASFNGINLINGSSSSLRVQFNENNTNAITVSGVDLSSTGLGLTTASSNFQSDSEINTRLNQLTQALSTLRTQSSTFGSNLSVVQTRQDFTKDLINTLKGGADNLVLADTNEEGANLLALQTRQQLSTTALSLASQADQNVLRLF